MNKRDFYIDLNNSLMDLAEKHEMEKLLILTKEVEQIRTSKESLIRRQRLELASEARQLEVRV